ncbi:MAG TPA: SDR family NAD(P)-dependent oxidoreductase [Gammaproteobacteria bacterium]|nr:SDR family NAD(P)-dependent oxidoreductase [Gammaproteobacteria bacterium]
MSKPLTDRIAVVAGATRGAGRGIARGLGEAGATVYCTGRSVRGARSDYDRPETIEETAELIEAAGGIAHAVRVDHSSEAEVERFFADLDARHGRLDVLVDSVAGEHPLMRQWCSFWETDLSEAEALFRQAFLSHVITVKHAAPILIRARRGLIVEVTENDIIGAGGNPLARNAKDGLKLLALGMAAELEPHAVAAVAVTPGFLRSERMLEHFGVDEENWREAGKQDRNFLESESPLFVGRVVAALAADPSVLARTGQLLSSWEAAREYGISDVDGRRPDWGALDIDFSMHPPWLLELMRTGARIELEWLEALARRARRFLGQLPS